MRGGEDRGGGRALCAAATPGKGNAVQRSAAAAWRTTLKLNARVGVLRSFGS